MASKRSGINWTRIGVGLLVGLASGTSGTVAAAGAVASPAPGAGAVLGPAAVGTWSLGAIVSGYYIVSGLAGVRDNADVKAVGKILGA